MRALVLVVVMVAGCGDDGGQKDCVGNNCQCGPTATCNLSCPAGGACAQQCDGDCDVTCAAGNCAQQCGAGAACTASCAGGGCTQQCDPNATCAFTCSGGACIQQCHSNPSCTATCTGGNCLGGGG